MKNLPPEALQQVAAYFQTLAANVSRHLSLMTQHGFVARESRGTSVYYRIADPTVYALCDLVCGNIAKQLEREAESRQAMFSSVQ